MPIAVPFARRKFDRHLEESRVRLQRMAYAWSHDIETAKDLAQDALLKALRSRDQLRDPAQIDAWLFRILRNCWTDLTRKKTETPGLEGLDPIDESSPEHLLGKLDTVTRVRAAVRRLPVGQREVLTLVDLEDKSYADVALILGIPVGTVMSRLCRARRALKEQLQPKSTRPTVRPLIRGVK